MASTKHKLEVRLGELKNARKSWESAWTDMQDFILPEHGQNIGGGIDFRNDGQTKDASIYDGTATEAVGRLAAGMQSGLTSPARPWFRLGFSDPALSDNTNVKNWLFEVERRMREVYSRTNLYNGLYHVYAELGAFNTAALGVFEDFDNIIRVRPYTIGEFYLDLDGRYEVDTFVTEVSMTARQIVDRYGLDNVSETIRTAWRNNHLDGEYTIVQFILPNDGRLEEKEFMGRPYLSVHYERGQDDGQLLQVSGFDEFPVLTPRWDAVADQVYGIGPGREQLANVKMLQKLQEKYLIAADKMADPPLKASGEFGRKNINTVPGGITYVGSAQLNEGVAPLYNVPPSMLQPVTEKIIETQNMIKRGFFNDLFLLLATTPQRQMTATEVAERHEEKLLMLGPVLERLHTELLDPLIDRTFSVMLRSGLIPEPPEEIQGQELKVEYVSLLAQAQKMVGVTAIEQTAAFVGNLAGVKPDVLDKMNFDQAVDEYADALGLPPELIVSDEEVQALRLQRAQQAQAQARAEAMMTAADGAKTLSEADMGGNNALNAVLGRSPQ